MGPVQVIRLHSSNPAAQPGTVKTAWLNFTVRPVVGGQSENRGHVVFFIVAPT